MDKYQEVFNKYATPLPDVKIAEQVNALLEKKYQANFTPVVLKNIRHIVTGKQIGRAHV